MERSAEWLRGAIEALNRAQRDFTVTVPELQAEYVALLAAAEARESFPIPDTLPAVPEAREAGKPTAAEVLAAAEKALEGALRLDPHCDHAEIHREGFLWTVCDQCGKRWADDEGGFKTDPANKYIIKVEEALAIIAQWKEAHHAK